MAQAEHLPIYKASYDLCLSLEQVVRSFSRYHKYTLGTDLRDGARRVLKLVVRANTRRDKVPVLLELREEVEELKVILRLCQDVKAFANFDAFEQAITKAVEIAKQNASTISRPATVAPRTSPAMTRRRRCPPTRR